MDIALLLVRVAIGAVLAAHGAQKLFGWFDGHGIRGTSEFLETLGFHPGRPYAWLNGLTEFVGGIALAAGFLTPLAAAVIAGVMLTAIAVVHWDKGFFTMNGGYEFPLVLAVGAIALAFSGAGRWSLDHLFGWSLGGEEWGIAAIASALVIAGRTAHAHRERRRPIAA